MLPMPTRRTLRQKLPTCDHTETHRNENGEAAIPPEVNDADRASPIQTRDQPSNDSNASSHLNDDDIRTQRVQKTDHPKRHSDARRSFEKCKDDHQDAE